MGDGVGGLDEHLGRVTAPIETGSPERPGFDERGLEARIRGCCGDVVSRSAADDEDVEVGHRV
ncbi:MAG: hypothetical protein ACI9YT_002813 [Halobacteriales archaeon]